MPRKVQTRAALLALFVALALFAALGCAAPLRGQTPGGFSGQRAFKDIQRLVAFGPRPAGSAALAASRRWIIGQLQESGARVETDSFTASTPVGNIPMTNLIAKIPGEQPSIIMLAGHYDTKLFTTFHFVGANDGGSSAAFLLEMARVLGQRKHRYTIWLVFFDGEEALKSWSATDSLYGSREMVNKLAAEGQLDRIKAMILVDMVGDANLDIRRDTNSTPWLSDLLFQTADRLGYSRYFLGNQLTAIDDDHMPFVNAGVPAVDVIDLDYGPDNSYWHTAQDTLDKCSPQSLRIVGQVVTTMLNALQYSSRLR